MDPLLMGIMAGGGLLSIGGGIAQSLIGASAASRAAAGALGQIDLAQMTAKNNLQFIQQLYAPFIAAGTNALGVLQSRIYSGTEQRTAVAQQRLSLESKVKQLSQVTDFASFPLFTGEKASERREAAWYQAEYDRKQKLAAAQSELDLFNKQQADLAPLYQKQDEENASRMSRISTSLDQIAKLSDLPTTIADIRTELQNDPVYNFRIAEGERTLNRAAAARGTFFSGAAMKQLADFSLALTGEETDKYINRRVQALNAAVTGLGAELGEQNQSVSQALSLANLGLTGVTGSAQATTGITGAQTQLAGQAANITAQGEMAKAGAVQSGIGSIMSTVGGLSTLALLTQPKVTTTPSTPTTMPTGTVTYSERNYPGTLPGF